jgi:hypothetical protein
MRLLIQRAGNRWCYLPILIIVLVFTTSCMTAPKHLDVSPSFTKARYKTIGIIVVRVGCQHPYGVSMAMPTPKTDYSNRSPKPGSLGLDGGIGELPIPVYIEEEHRLKESFRYYPRTSSEPVHNRFGSYVTEFYANLTPQFYAAVENVLKRKGYGIVDIKKASETWSKPLSESRVEEIIDNSLAVADAVLLIQYMDIGKDSSSESLGLHRVQRQGAINIEYNVSIFDCRTKERVLSFYKDHFPSLLTAMENDPDIISDPVKRSKITRDVQRLTDYTAYTKHTLETQSISVSFIDQELVDFLLKYIEKGIVYDLKGWGRVKWTGLYELLP